MNYPGGGEGNILIAVGNNATTVNYWLFDNTGNLRLPGNTFAVNYANGTQVPLGGGGSTGNVTFDDVTVQGDNTQLNLSAGADFTANLAYVRVRSGDAPSHIHMDTGNNEAYDLIIGDDDKFVQVSSTGNIIMSSYDGNASSTWTLDTTGNLTLPLGSIVYETNIPDQSLSGSAIALKPIGGTTANQQLLIYPTAFDGDHIHMTSGNLYTTELFLGSDNFYVKLANTGNVVINSNDGNSSNAMWTFGTDGNLTLPGNLVINGLTNVFGSNVALLQSNPDLPLLSVSSGSNGGVSSLWVEDIGNVGTSNIAAVYVNPTSGSGIVRIAVGQNGGNAGPNLWDFNANGTTTFPGNLISSGASPAPSISGFSSVSALQFTNGNSNVTVNANSNLWTFDSTGNLTAPGNVSAVGNITGNYILGNGSQLTGISGNIANITANVISFNTAAGINVAAGQMAWNSSDGTLDIGLSYANVVLQVGQETHYVVRNDSGNTILNGTAVYCSGVAGGSGRIEASPMTGSTDPVKFLGLATQDITDGVNGVVTYFGYVRGLDTRGTANTAISVGDETWAVGDQLYVHPTAAGKLTNVEPAAPNVKICVASILIRNQTSGVLFVRPTTNLDMVDLSDVQIDTPANGEVLQYVSANSRWENTSISSIANGNSNVSIASSNGNVTIAAVGNTTMTVTGTGANITGTLNATGNITGSYLISAHASGDEGGEISLAQPPNGNLSGGITIDAYQNTLRMFEQGGTARGLSIDIANSPAGGGTAIGYRDIPQVAAGNVTLAATDAGKHYYSTTAGNLTLTIPLNSTVPFTTGTAISIVVQAAGNILVNAASGVTLYMAGNSTAANRVVGGYGMATLMKVASDTWFINGAGVA
jgi:hypothetical protein